MYENWTESVTLSKFYWYPLTDLVNHLHELRDLILSNSPAKLVKYRLPNLQDKVLPATESKRFPADEFYLCEGIGELIEELDKLNLAMSILINPRRLKHNYQNYKSVGELEIHVLGSINQLLCNLELNPEIVMNRDSFESRNCLVWRDPLPDQPSKKIGNSISPGIHSKSSNYTGNGGND